MRVIGDHACLLCGAGKETYSEEGIRVEVTPWWLAAVLASGLVKSELDSESFVDGREEV